MTKARIAGGAFAAVLVLLAVAAGYRAFVRSLRPTPAISPAIAPSPAAVDASPEALSQVAAADAHAGFLYGRVTTVDGATYEGRLRWGGDEEAFWGDYFNGAKAENPWVSQVPAERLPKERLPISILGFEIGQRERPVDLGRLFMARFGDIARIEAHGRDVRVTLRSGSVIVLDRLEASDFDDGVRVWDSERGIVDLDSLRVRAIELLPTAALGAVPSRLHGTVSARQGEFTGFVQWNREECVGTDELDGRTADGPLGIRFDTIRAIARRPPEGSLVTLADGRELALSGTDEVGRGNRGLYVDDRRYGRVLVSWEAFERVDFSPPGTGGSGPGYEDFPPGLPLTGSVTTRGGRRLAGRLVYDLDESETTDTLDAPSRGVDYTLPFGRVASIAMAGREAEDAEPARVTLQDGEVLELERAGDLGTRNAGLLIFLDDSPRPEYVPWTDVERMDFDRPPAISPPLGGL